jgi:hypothetical protein
VSGFIAPIVLARGQSINPLNRDRRDIITVTAANSTLEFSRFEISARQTTSIRLAHVQTNYRLLVRRRVKSTIKFLSPITLGPSRARKAPQKVRKSSSTRLAENGLERVTRRPAGRARAFAAPSHRFGRHTCGCLGPESRKPGARARYGFSIIYL